MHPPPPGRSPAAPKRSPMPYGVVMATGGAAHLAGLLGPRRWALALLVVAVAVAVMIPIRAAVRERSVRAAFFGQWSPGDLTVPLGLAVLGVDVAAEGGHLAATLLAALTWVTSAVVLARLARMLRPRLWDVDGSWFLAPAAVLGDALATCAVHPSESIASWAALIAAGLGIVSYLMVLGLAAIRIARHGLLEAPKAPWWISAGCGGLAAATAGQVAGLAPVRLPVGGVQAVVVGLWVIACLALIPVVLASIAHVVHHRGRAGNPPWPPTFSTAVFALGTLEAARWSDSTALHQVGRAAGWATIVLWLVTAALLARHAS